jgi:hypothetical protein
MKLPHLPRIPAYFATYDRLALQTGLELLLGAVGIVILMRWVGM